MAMHPMVLERASLSALRVRADRWDEHSGLYLQRCAEARNVEACYTLGMVYNHPNHIIIALNSIKQNV